MSPLERRYRRLLAVLPPAHRVEYGEEMLGVLMLDSVPGQRRPRLGESVDLLLTGLRMRLGREPAPSRGADAAAVFGFLGAIGMFVLTAMPRLLDRVWRWKVPFPWATYVTPMEWFRAGAWLAVVALLIVGRRTLAAAGAWVIAVAEGWWLHHHYWSAPDDVLRSWRPLVAAAAVAVALSVPVARRRGLTLLGRRGLVEVAVATALAMFGPLLEPLFAIVHTYGDHAMSVKTWPSGPGWAWNSPQFALGLPGREPGIGPVTLAVYAIIVAIGIRALLRLERPVRWRVLLPALALLAFVMLPQYDLAQQVGGVLAGATLIAGGYLVGRSRARRSYVDQPALPPDR